VRSALRSLGSVADSIWGRLAITVGLLTLAFSLVDFESIVRLLSGGRWTLFALAVGLLLASLPIAAFRWKLFLEAAGFEISGLRALRAYAAGAFATNFLPSQFGGDAVRALLVAQRGERIRALTTVVIDRLTMFICLVAAAWLFIAPQIEKVPPLILGTLAAVTAFLGLLALLVAPFSAGVRRFVLRFLPAAARLGPEIAATARACVSSRSILVRTAVLGLCYEALVFGAILLIARTLRLELPSAAIVAATPPALLLAALPLSIGGLGVREGGYILLLAPAGASATTATVLSLMFGTAYALSTLPGGLTLLLPWSSDRARSRWHGMHR
jgi:uncharacterized membrane protein YbhN (UPF0104 family)